MPRGTAAVSWNDENKAKLLDALLYYSTQKFDDTIAEEMAKHVGGACNVTSVQRYLSRGGRENFQKLLANGETGATLTRDDANLGAKSTPKSAKKDAAITGTKDGGDEIAKVPGSKSRSTAKKAAKPTIKQEPGLDASSSAADDTLTESHGVKRDFDKMRGGDDAADDAEEPAGAKDPLA